MRLPEIGANENQECDVIGFDDDGQGSLIARGPAMTVLVDERERPGGREPQEEKTC
jgi:hypothetical protein